MNNIQELLSRFIDDREALTNAEWQSFLGELEKAPSLVAQLRDQLLLDDYLAQKLSVDRVDFLSQIGQRVNDYEEQVTETFNQVADLRSLAEEELLHPSPRRSTFLSSWGLSLGIVAAAALICTTVAWQWNWGQPITLATVEAVTGTVEIRDGKQTIPLTNGSGLGARQELVTGADSSLVWRYADGTQIRLEANTTARLNRHPDHEGKRVYLDRGSLVADIAPQLTGRPMTFVTPHAEAKVVGTKFQLSVRETDTELEVTEGIVDFSRIGATAAVRVVANEVSHISGLTIERKPVSWPTQRNDEQLVFLFKNFLDPPLARNPASNKLRITPLQTQGSVGLWHDQALSLHGGSYWSSDAGEDLLTLFKDRQELTVEIVLGAEAMGDMPSNGSGTVLSFAAQGDKANWALRSQDGQWQAWLATQHGEQPQVLAMPLHAADSPLHHVAWTYRPGQWIGYCDGEQVAVREDLQGNFQNWHAGALTIGADENEARAWNGNVFGFAVYRRVLSPDELALSARHARIAYGAIGQ